MKAFKITLMVILLAFVSGCGEGSDRDQEVTEVRFLANDIQINESVRVEAEFKSGTSDLFDVRATVVTFEVSSALRVETDTFRIFEGNDDDTEVVIPDRILECSDGRTLIKIFFEREDLRGNEFGDRYKIKFNVIGQRATEVAAVSGAAGSDLDVDCDEDFLTQESDAVRVS